jgi:hypothetical protein
VFTEENINNVPQANLETGDDALPLVDLDFEEKDVIAKLNKLREDKASGADAAESVVSYKGGNQ